jgi:hypothetical protein
MMRFGTVFGDLRRLRDGGEAAACIGRSGGAAGWPRVTNDNDMGSGARTRHASHAQGRADTIGDGSHASHTHCAGARCATAALDHTEGPTGRTPSASHAAGRAGRVGRTVSRAGQLAALPGTTPRTGRAEPHRPWAEQERQPGTAEHRRAARTTTASTTPARKKRESHGEEGREEGRRLTPATNLSTTTAATPQREHGSGGGDGFGEGREREGEGGAFGATWVAGWFEKMNGGVGVLVGGAHAQAAGGQPRTRATLGLRGHWAEAGARRRPGERARRPAGGGRSWAAGEGEERVLFCFYLILVYLYLLSISIQI